ncbi:N-alpha-acetyltransferase 60 [Pelomyxa schiedti]|nr:N-alpha-acetyltransferase 60 [Pelomyxa schiedti]
MDSTNARSTASDDVCVRKMTEGDLTAVERLHLELFPVVYGPSFYRRLLRPSIFALVAETMQPSGQKMVIGVATARILGSDSQDDAEDGFDECCGWLCSFFPIIKPDVGYIMTIGVTGSCRRTGVGSLLLQAISDTLIAHGAHTITLHVKVGNNSALSFYRRHNFQVVTRLTNYYDFSAYISNPPQHPQQPQSITTTSSSSSSPHNNHQHQQTPQWDYKSLSRDALHLRLELQHPQWSWGSLFSFNWAHRKTIDTNIKSV